MDDGLPWNSVVAADGLVIAVQFDGLVHCLDARTGERYWAHDINSRCMCTPLICDKDFRGGF